MTRESHMFIVVLLVLSLSCDGGIDPAFYGCCDNPPLVEQFGNARLFVPNIFTPNGDHINDYFVVSGDSISYISELTIRNQNGQTVYHLLNGGANDEYWDGRVNGELRKGLYDFALTVVAYNGTIEVFQGRVCNYPCGQMESDELLPIDNCHFTSEWEVFPPPNPPDYPGCFK